MHNCNIIISNVLYHYYYFVADSARNSPMSEHSSHFDSVLGTAINLGIHSVNEKGSLHYPKVSALAREAKELQGVRSANGQKKDEGITAEYAKKKVMIYVFLLQKDLNP